MKSRILVLAEDAGLRATLARWLLGAGYAVELAETSKRAREVAAGADISLALIAPDGFGGEAAELARALKDAAPLIAISAASREDEVLAQVSVALSTEADDEHASESQTLRFEGYTLDVAGRSFLDATGAELALTRSEFSLLLAFVRAPGRLLSRDELRHAVAGRGAEPDDRSVDVLISRLRRKIEPDPKAPRLIVTLPGEGYKFTAKPQAVLPRPDVATVALVATQPASLARPAEAAPAVPAPAMAASVAPVVRAPSPGTLRLAAIGGVAAGVILGLALGLWYSGFAGLFAPAASAQHFDAALVPLVLDNVRAQLAQYQHEPDAKALAISRQGWGMSFAAADIESAKSEAIARCQERDKSGFCRIYAVGDTVVWPKSTLPLPLPADIRDDVQNTPLNADGLQKLWQAIWRVSPPQPIPNYITDPGHKALAAAISSSWIITGRPTRAEAIRLAIERCSDYGRSPCLLLSVDGMMSVAVPQSYRPTAPFTVAGELTMSEAERQRVAEIYAGRDWRALAKGGSGHWYAVSGLADEIAAADSALKACHDAESNCTLHAIGNFRVGEKLEPKSGG
jgi:DNA-binding response OmpR family regulator